jgi:hypothetical protein
MRGRGVLRGVVNHPRIDGARRRVATATIDRPREVVAAYLQDPANDTNWIGGLRSARLLTPAPVAVGPELGAIGGMA